MFSFFDNENVSVLRDRWTPSKHAEHIEHRDTISNRSNQSYFCSCVRWPMTLSFCECAADDRWVAKRIFSPVVYLSSSKIKSILNAHTFAAVVGHETANNDWGLNWTDSWKRKFQLLWRFQITKCDACLRHTSRLSQFKVDPWCSNLFQRSSNNFLLSFLAFICPRLFIQYKAFFSNM